MEEYQLFDELLTKSKKLRDFCDDNEKMMFKVIRMDLKSDGKVHWLECVGRKIERV